jgi:hypothetical protein
MARLRTRGIKSTLNLIVSIKIDGRDVWGFRKVPTPSTAKDRGREPDILAGESNLRPRERNDRDN